MSKIDPKIVKAVEEAFEAARQASNKTYQDMGGDNYACGFAWVNIKPGTSKVAKYLKDMWGARRSYHGGIDVWNPGGLNVQNIDIKEDGAQAFAKVLREQLGVTAYASSRLD